MSISGAELVDEKQKKFLETPLRKDQGLNVETGKTEQVPEIKGPKERVLSQMFEDPGQRLTQLAALKDTLKREEFKRRLEQLRPQPTEQAQPTQQPELTKAQETEKRFQELGSMPVGKAIGESLKQDLTTAANIYDTIKSALTVSKSTNVKKAEASFADASNIIRQDIELVKMGAKSYDDALRDIDTAISAIGRLEGETKGIGKINLRYWLDNGKELEASILSEKAILANQRAELLAARLQWEQAQINARFGA